MQVYPPLETTPLLHPPGLLAIVSTVDAASQALSISQTQNLSIQLWSPPNAGAFMGPLFFRALLTEAVQRISERSPQPPLSWEAVLDCAQYPAIALATLRHGFTCLRLAPAPQTTEVISALAKQQGARLLSCPHPIFAPHLYADFQRL